jgi:AcrR family transcriptional regulator
MLTKRLLKDALLRLLEDSAIQKISVTQLCEEAGINRATFYRHYGSQYDVLNEMEMTMLEDIESMLGESCPTDLNAFQKQAELICVYLREHSSEAKLFFGNTGIGSDFEEKLFSHVKWQSILERFCDPTLDASQKELILAFWQNGFFSLLRQWLVADIPLKPDAVARLMLRIAMSGLELNSGAE